MVANDIFVRMGTVEPIPSMDICAVPIPSGGVPVSIQHAMIALTKKQSTNMTWYAVKSVERSDAKNVQWNTRVINVSHGRYLP